MRSHLPLLLALATGVVTMPALAQYKVVDPDGKITYTDRPVPPPAGGQVQTLRAGSSAAAPAGQAALPLDLRGPAGRFPVTLYTGAECAPCDTARLLLQQRGIPYAERSVVNDDDVAALQRLTGGRTLPSLTVGAQPLRGLLEADWQATLDLAGYPRTSRLPRGWVPGPATPLVARAPVPADGVQPPAVRPAAPAPAEPEPPAGGIRF